MSAVGDYFDSSRSRDGTHHDMTHIGSYPVSYVGSDINRIGPWPVYYNGDHRIERIGPSSVLYDSAGRISSIVTSDEWNPLEGTAHYMHGRLKKIGDNEVHYNALGLWTWNEGPVVIRPHHQRFCVACSMVSLATAGVAAGIFVYITKLAQKDEDPGKYWFLWAVGGGFGIGALFFLCVAGHAQVNACRTRTAAAPGRLLAELV